MTANLHDTTDAAVWAKEFCKKWPVGFSQVPCREGLTSCEDWEDILVSWFANAITAGVDSVEQENRRDYFAGLAMLGMIEDAVRPGNLARIALMVADAMIAEGESE